MPLAAYELGRRLGAGAFGEVFLATCPASSLSFWQLCREGAGAQRSAVPLSCREALTTALVAMAFISFAIVAAVGLLSTQQGDEAATGGRFGQGKGNQRNMRR